MTIVCSKEYIEAMLQVVNRRRCIIRARSRELRWSCIGPSTAFLAIVEILESSEPEQPSKRNGDYDSWGLKSALYI